MSELTRRVKALEQECKRGFSPENENLRHRAIRALESLEEYDLPIKATKMVSQTILSIQKAPVIEGPLKLAIFFDISSPDHNSAITITQMTALNGGIPFITSRAIFTGTEDIEGKPSGAFTELAACNEKWEIYAHGEFLVFLPKALMTGTSEEEKLKAFDLASDGTLKKITPQEALRGSGGKRNYQMFTELFSPTPVRAKVIYIDGHGGLNSVASLGKETFLQFLSFLKDQKCAALTVSSCYSGGTSSGLYLPQEESLEGVPFPVIVKSIGDFPTLAGQEAERDLKLYLDEVASFFQQATPPTVLQFRRMLIKAEQNKGKVPQNLAQVYFPHASGSPGGVRSIGEGGKSYSLTIAKEKTASLETPDGISVERTDFVEVYPLVVKTPVICEDKGPVLLSMVPSDSHHIIQSVELKMEAPYDFLNRTAAFHKNAGLEVHKGFFIHKIKSENSVVKDVVLFLGPEGNFCLYVEKGDYYFLDLEKAQTQKITQFQYALLRDWVETATRPSAKMVKAATGGQQDEQTFFKAYQKRGFSIEPLAIESMSVRDKESYVFHLLTTGKSQQAQDIFSSENLSTDMRDLFGTPLLYEVVKAGDQKFLDQLLQMGVDVNCLSGRFPNETPLRLVISKGDQETLNKLLGQPHLDLNLANTQGSTAISMALGNGTTMFEQLIKRGADVDKLNAKGHTLLGRYAYLNEAENVDRLLAAGADPNKGSPSALQMAIIGGDIKTIQKLLNAGGSAFKKDAQGRIPFFRAVKTATPQVLKLLLEQPDCDLTLEDSGKTAMKFALESGSIEKVRFLIDEGVRLPDVSDWSEASDMQALIKKYCKIGSWEAVEQLLKWNNSRENGFHDSVAEAVADTSPEKVTDFIRRGLIDPARIFSTLTKLAVENFEPYKEALQLAVDQGADPMAKVQYIIPFQYALESKKTEILKIFVPKIKPLTPEDLDTFIGLGDPSLVKLLDDLGADLYTQPLFNLAVHTNNLEIVKQFIGKVEVNPKNENGGYLPMEFAANANNLELLKLLKEHGGDLNRHGNAQKATPFAIIAGKGDINILNWALDQGAEVNPKNPQGLTPLEAAEGNGVIVKRLLQAGAEWSDKAVIAVVKTGDLKLIKYCLKHGANIGTEEAYLAAIQSGNLEVLELVQSEGGDLRVETLSNPGFLLEELYNKGHREMFLELLKMGVVPEDNFAKRLLWRTIINNHDMKSFRALMKVETDLSIPYTASIENGNLPMLLELEKHGYPKNFELEDDVYANLIRNEHVEVLEHLFELGLEIDRTIGSQNLFQFSVDQHRNKVVKLLLDLGVDPDQEIESWSGKRSALILAIGQNDPQLVKMLIEAGATVSKEIMDLAYKIDNKEILKLLKD